MFLFYSSLFFFKVNKNKNCNNKLTLPNKNINITINSKINNGNMSDSDNNSLPSNDKSPNNDTKIKFKLNDSSLNTITVSNNSENDKSTLSASNSGKSELNRKKIILGPGYSLMDWIRFSRQTPDLAGNQGILRLITLEELAKHKKKDDCWLAIYDKVYNVTPYIKFHPGGVDGLNFC